MVSPSETQLQAQTVVADAKPGIDETLKGEEENTVSDADQESTEASTVVKKKKRNKKSSQRLSGNGY